MEFNYQQKSLVATLLAFAVFTRTCDVASGMFGADGTCGNQKNYPGEQAEVTITGLLPIHEGPDCEVPNPEGVQMLEAARWAASKINQEQLIPGTTIGVNIWDICGSGDAALRAAMSAVVEGGYLQHNCRDTQHAGMLMPRDIVNQVAPFLRDVGLAHMSLIEEEEEAEGNLQFDAVIPLLLGLNWTSVAIAAPTVKDLKDFGHVAAGSHVCVSAEALLPEDASDTAGYIEMFEDLQGSETTAVVLIGPQDHLQAVLAHAAQASITNLSYILVPSGPLQEEVFQGLESVIGPHGIPAVRRASQTVPEFGQHFMDAAYYSGPPLYPTLTAKEYVEEKRVIQMVKSIHHIALALSHVVKEQCAGTGWCNNATINSLNSELKEDDPDVFTSLNINPMIDQYDLLYMEVGDSTNSFTFTGLGSFSNGILEADLGPLANLPKSPCTNCRCINVGWTLGLLTDLKFRTEPWVIICSTMAFTGCLVAFSVAIFICIRVCRNRTSEGSQGFSLLLVFSCVLLYAALLPYSFEASSLVCQIRRFSTDIAYSLIFSIFLARSLMLATADSEGLVGHVSGLVQVALLFFMVMVQFGLGLQQWLMQSPTMIFHDKAAVNGFRYTCGEDHLEFLISLSYVMFLLLLQLLVSPFIVRSRRNYHEGLLFFIATLLVSGVWGTWASLYMILPPEWGDACVCLGIAATPTIIIAAVFVPKTYLMVRASARDSACGPLRPISRAQSGALTGPYGLYDSVHHLPTNVGYSHAYGPDPTVCHNVPPIKENLYETYHQFQPSPHKLTQF